MRKPGYYWIRIKKGSPWEIVYYDQTGWWVTSPNNRLSNIYKVGKRVRRAWFYIGAIEVDLCSISLVLSAAAFVIAIVKTL